MTTRTPIVGRSLELDDLFERFDAVAEHGAPRVVTVLGAAGIGKSRLVDELVRRLESSRRDARCFRGSAPLDGPAFGVIENLLRERFAETDGRNPEMIRREVSEIFRDQRVSEILSFLGDFLGLEFPESPFLKAFDEEPAERARIRSIVLRRFFQLDAVKNGPTLLVLEDLHYASADSLALIHRWIRGLHTGPLMVLCTARPSLVGTRADWFEATHHDRFDLSPLSPDASAALMAELLSVCETVPEELIDAAVEVAGGSPYLLEQMLPALIDAEVLTPGEEGFAVDLSRLDTAQLPFSIDQAIAARLASLGADERSILEMAAIMGGVFWLGALVALRRIGETAPELWGGLGRVRDQLIDTLEQLEDRDYVLELPDSTIPGEREFAFKHNLEREELRRLVPAPQVEQFHRVVGEWLEYRLAERAEEQCELLAHHFAAAKLDAKAAAYFLLAGDKARARFANGKAAEFYERGLTLLGDADRLRRLDALHHYGDVLQLAGRNEDAERAFRDMLALAYALDLRAKGGAAHNRLGRLYRALGRLDQAMRHLGTGHALFEAAGDFRGIASSLDDVGKVHWMRGAYEAAERFMQAALERRQSLGDQQSISLSFNNLGLVFQDSGRFLDAQRHFQEALVLRRAIDDAPGIAQTLNNLGSVAQDCGEHERAEALYREALEVAQETGDRMRQAVILTNLGETRYRLGDPKGAIQVLSEASDIAATLGDVILEGEILRGLAKASLLVKDGASAREHIDQSVTLFEQARSRAFLGTALRTKAEVEIAGGWGGDAYDRARAAFERSLEVLREVGNEPELAQTCRAYARFLRESVEPPEVTRAEELEGLATATEQRLRASEAEGVPAPLPGEDTDPRVRLP